ncbi:MAG: translation initiation factor IF-2 [Desulfobacterales bacterium]|nr:MAG: translation initiation factor IF-2 [Desulfobacterales bacterium]
MAPMRIYELARDLNMTNQILLSKLSEMDIVVKSHMSSLDDETVAKVKSELYGKKEETIVETRIKPTVIRRRRKKVQIDVVPLVEPTAEEVQAAANPAEAAEIEPTDTAAQEKEAIAETPKETKEEPLEEKPAAEEPSAVEAQKPPVKPAVKPKKIVKKTKKKEPAAKIIRLPVTPPAPPLEMKKVQPEHLKAKIEKLHVDKKALAEEIPERETRKKKKKRRDEEEEVDRKFLKKKISFLKKAVVEGEDLYDDTRRARKPRKIAKAKKTGIGQKTQITVAKAIKRRIKIDEAIILADLAKRMGIKANEIIQSLMTLGVMATVNQSLDFETAALVASEFHYEVERATFEEEVILKQEKDDPKKLTERPPVVTIMGHVDHGKTSLLDVIRKTRITELEAGGITQHIGAYHVTIDKGQIAFLDTPGHEAFTAMRARGAQITDIVVLVVAADDGVMPQTIEAINHARVANVPIIVAINKIDKTNADPDRVKRELSEHGLTPEDWGGDTIFVNVSAKQNIGIEELLEMILLQAEVLELKANPEKPAIGHVVEAKIDSGRGAVATVLVRDGTLRNGDPVVCGVHFGKIRAMLSDTGLAVESAGPSIPVEVLGLSGVPMAGDELIALVDEKSAKQVSMHRLQKQRTKELAQTSRLSLDKLYEQMQHGDVKELNLIIKADVHGSIEALVDSLTKLSNEEVNVGVVHSATGTIAESDVSLAAVSNAIIIGFNVRPSPKVQALANDEQVDMRFYNVIYDVIKDVKDAMVGLMESTYEERILGSAEVREVFHIPKVGAVAGCYVTDGKIERGQLLRVVRDGVVFYEGKNSSLRRFKDDVKEVQAGYECGIGIENFNDIKIGDVLECYYLEEIKPQVE